MNTLREYHDFYLTLDVLLLADVFEKFRHSMLKSHALGCLHFPSLFSMTLQLALNVTGVEMEHICDSNIYLMIESAIRGGLSYVSQRYGIANFPDMPDYRPDLPTSHLLYFDCNSLYSICQTYGLPVDGFRFLTESELVDFDVTAVPVDSETGYFVECYLHYPPHLHDAHNAYPLTSLHRQRHTERHSSVDDGRNEHCARDVYEAGVEPTRQDALCHVSSLNASGVTRVFGARGQ